MSVDKSIDVWCATRGCDKCTKAPPGESAPGWGRGANRLLACPDHAIEEEPGADPVNHPSHYTLGGIEVIDAIEAWGLGFHEGCVVKYVARARHKGRELEDLRKARWYLDRLIKRIGVNK
mgnify:FL=1